MDCCETSAATYVEDGAANSHLAAVAQFLVGPLRTPEHPPVPDDLLDPLLHLGVARAGGGEFDLAEQIGLADGFD